MAINPERIRKSVQWRLDGLRCVTRSMTRTARWDRAQRVPAVLLTATAYR